MRFPGFPRLPVSRRRHDELAELVCVYNRIASEDLAEYKRRARKAEARVAELEQDRDDLVGRIKALYDARQRGSQTVATEHAERNLYAVLDGHDHQEREGFRVEGHADVPDDVKLAPEPDDTDIHHPRTGRWSHRERARDWLTSGSFKGVRRER